MLDNLENFLLPIWGRLLFENDLACSDWAVLGSACPVISVTQSIWQLKTSLASSSSSFLEKCNNLSFWALHYTPPHKTGGWWPKIKCLWFARAIQGFWKTFLLWQLGDILYTGIAEERRIKKPDWKMKEWKMQYCTARKLGGDCFTIANCEGGKGKQSI